MSKNVLYYYWGELNKNDAVKAFVQMGYAVTEYTSCHTTYDYDEDNISKLKAAIDKMTGVSFIFSFNYFPDVSRVAMEKGLSYISWVYDCPHYTLESLTVGNSCNHIFIFDSELVAKYRKLGINTVEYMPLPARIIDSAANMARTDFLHDISFVGTLYDGDKDQYGQIKSFPACLQGKLDGYIQAQHLMYGADLINALIDDKQYLDIKQYVKSELGKEYRKADIEIFRNIVKRRVTMIDRISALERIGKAIERKEISVDSISLYCEKSHPELPVENMGYADHDIRLPQVFGGSRINLNISLRSISSGVPLRVMHILGAGGFCLTNYQSDLERHFENGRSLVWYYDEDELLEKTKYYLSHDEERESIAREGYELAAQQFSYQRLLGSILKCTGLLE